MKSILINQSGHLVFTLDNGDVIDTGYVIGAQGPRGDRGPVGMQGAPGLDSTVGCTGPTGDPGASICSLVATSPTSIVLVMSDARQIAIPMHASLLPACPTGPTGAQGVGLQTLSVSDNRIVAVMTDGTRRDVTTTSRCRVLGTVPNGAMPVYYDPVSDKLFAVRS